MFILKYMKVPSFDYFVFYYFWITGRIKDQTLSKRPPCIISIGTFFTSTRHNRVCGRACRIPFSSLFLRFLDISSQHSVLEFLKASRPHRISFGSAESFESYRASGRDIQSDRRTDFFLILWLQWRLRFVCTFSMRDVGVKKTIYYDVSYRARPLTLQHFYSITSD